MNERAEVEELGALLRSRVPLILIETHDEPRVLKLLAQACNFEQQVLTRWSIVDGLGRVHGTGGGIDRGPQGGVTLDGEGRGVYQTNELLDALKHIDKSPQNGVYVLCDAHPGFKDPVSVRLIREIAMDHSKCARTLIFISPKLDEVPTELLRLASHFRPQLPTREDIRRILNEEAQVYLKNNDEKVRAERGVVDQLIMHLMGLEFDEVRRLVRQALQADGELNQKDLKRVLDTKHAVLGGSGILGFEHSTLRFDDVGGLAQMKHWVSLRRAPFLEVDAQTIDRPRGMLLLGVMGGGKSLAARAIAGEWGVPLMRLDFGSMYNKFQGESERNLRQALAAAEGMAPCVLWIDEMEKGLGGGDGSEQDGGVSRRVLGTFLTWLSERQLATKPVFVIATANDISALPPELIRKGRFDEIFFVDFPSAVAREQIFSIHLRKRGLDPAQFQVKELAQVTANFSGAEIEQAIVAASFEARARQAAVSIEGLKHEIARTRPLSVVMAERINALRVWASERAVLAEMPLP